jgi:hypothetical protein
MLSRQPVHSTYKKRWYLLDQLGADITRETGASWKNLYRTRWGGLKEFLTQQVWRVPTTVPRATPPPSTSSPAWLLLALLLRHCWVAEH